MTEKRKFTKDEKLQFLKEVEQNGVKITLEKHGIYPATYYSWKKKFEQMGEDGFRHGMTPAHIKEIKRQSSTLPSRYKPTQNPNLSKSLSAQPHRKKGKTVLN